jgi:hypothetical protein
LEDVGDWFATDFVDFW